MRLKVFLFLFQKGAPQSLGILSIHLPPVYRLVKTQSICTREQKKPNMNSSGVTAPTLSSVVNVNSLCGPEPDRGAPALTALSPSH